MVQFIGFLRKNDQKACENYSQAFYFVLNAVFINVDMIFIKAIIQKLNYKRYEIF